MWPRGSRPARSGSPVEQLEYDHVGFAAHFTPSFSHSEAAILAF